MNPDKLPRRHLLQGLLAVGAASCARTDPPPAPAADPPQPVGDAWSRFRAEFALSPEWIHMTSFLLVSHPRAVREAIEGWRRKLDENPAYAVEEHGHGTHAQEAAATYMGARAEEIALTDSTTMGLGTLYTGLPLAAGDEVLTSTHDHMSTHAALLYATARAGAKLVKVPMYGRPFEATAAGMVDAIAKGITPATRAVAITWVHSATGVKTPVKGIAEAVAKANQGRAPEDRVILCVDGVHGFGVDDVTMGDLGCVFFAAGCHKWIFGPRGTGVIWGKADLWPLLKPSIPSFSAELGGWWMGNSEGSMPKATANVMSPGGFHSFEHRWALPAAFELHQRLGKAKVAARIHALNRQCKEGLKKMKHVTLHTPMEAPAGTFWFQLACSHGVLVVPPSRTTIHVPVLAVTVRAARPVASLYV